VSNAAARHMVARGGEAKLPRANQSMSKKNWAVYPSGESPNFVRYRAGKPETRDQVCASRLRITATHRKTLTLRGSITYR